MAKRKEKEPYIAPAYIFCFEMYECFQIKSLKSTKKLKKKKKEQLETHTHAIFCFATLAYYFFVILHLCRSLDMYFL